MKTKLKYLMVAAITCGAVLQTRAQGYIVPNGVYVGTNGSPGFELDVVQNPTNGNYTGFLLIPRAKTPPSTPYTNTFEFTKYADEGVRVFLVSSNQPLSLQPILANSYTELLFPNNYVFANGSPFYVGLYTGNTLPQNGIYSDPLFGWAQLVNNQGAIQFLDGSLEYGGGGIYAGTQNIIGVPEPSTFALATLGTLLLAWRRWRDSWRT